MSKQAVYNVFKGCAVILAVMFALGFIAAFLMDRYFPTSFEATAKNYDELRDTGLIQGYWLPDTMPKSVRDVRISWDLDSASASATFYIAPADIDELVKGFDIADSVRNSATTDQRFSRLRDEQLEMLTINSQIGLVKWITTRQ